MLEVIKVDFFRDINMKQLFIIFFLSTCMHVQLFAPSIVQLSPEQSHQQRIALIVSGIGFTSFANDMQRDIRRTRGVVRTHRRRYNFCPFDGVVDVANPHCPFCIPESHRSLRETHDGVSSGQVESVEPVAR